MINKQPSMNLLYLPNNNNNKSRIRLQHSWQSKIQKLLLLENAGKVLKQRKIFRNAGKVSKMQERFCKLVGKVLELWERFYHREKVGKVSKF